MKNSTEYKQVGLFRGPFTKQSVRDVNNVVTNMFNGYTRRDQLKTVLVVIQLKDPTKELVREWCTVGRTKPEDMLYITLFEVDQTPTFIE